MAPLLAPSRNREKSAGASIFWSATGLSPTATAGRSKTLLQNAGSLSARLPVTKTPEFFLPPLSARRSDESNDIPVGTIQELLESRLPSKLASESFPLDSGTGARVGRPNSMERRVPRHLAYPVGVRHPLAFPPKPPSRQLSRQKPNCRSEHDYHTTEYVHQISKLSLPHDADVFDVMRGGGVVRGELDQQIAEREAVARAIAWRRRNVAKESGDAERFAAQKRQHSKRRQVETPMLPQEPSTAEVTIIPKVQSEDFNRRVFDALVERRSSQLSIRTDDDNTESEMFPSRRDSQPRRPSILEHIAPKNPLVSRMRTLDSLGKEKRKLNRMQALLDCKRQEFEKRPEPERQQLSEAFQKHDVDNSGSLDHKEILACLADLGLKPHTQVESREVRRIINEVAVLGTIDFLQFVFEMIPRAREKMRELRKGPLLLEFKMFDRDESGYLDRNECRLILEMLCTQNLDRKGLDEMNIVFEESINAVISSAGQLDFDAFEELVSRARENHRCIVQTRLAEIYREEELDFDDLRQHADELVLLYDSFKRMDTRCLGSLGWDDIRLILIEYDLLPRDEVSQNSVIDDFAKTALFTNGKVKFQEFLRLVRTLRKDQLKKEEYDLKAMFNRLDRDRSDTLEVSEISTLLEAFGVQPHCWEDQMQIRRMLDQIDEDGSGNFCFDEFARLVQRVREYLAIAARRRERIAADELGFADRQVAELRDVFFTLDLSQQGCLTVEQLRKALDTLKTPMSPEDLATLVARFDVDGVGMLDFQGFLRFFKAVAPSQSIIGDLNSNIQSVVITENGK